MNVAQAIAVRRSVNRWTPEAPPRELVERLLEAATRAPNHYLTQPWRFVVLAGKAREELGAVMVARLRSRLVEPLRPQDEAALEAEQRKPLRAPVLIGVGCVRQEHPKALWLEEIAAVAAAVENMLLLAVELGLGAAWRTGVTDDPGVKAFFGLGEADHMAGIVYLGYADGDGEQKPRAPFSERTEWRGW